ncbi:MAG TPA: phosphoribosylanthranilate isomerase [Burkholderiaceae bacterium]|nr:phosphoribosylanthranilate isomerase [Burkholderiaceae bacterium]
MNRTRIKICGITRREDADAAVLAGADAIGLVAYPKSPRYVGPELAASLAKALPPFVTPVALFVNATRDEVGAYLDQYPGYLLQFHGDEDADECEQFGNAYVKAARMVEGFDLDAFANQHPRAQGILVDAWSEGYGGAGKTFDWSWLPERFDRPLVLSGGLEARNVAEAIARVRPWAVDVSSGVERSKGVKDASKIADFIKAVRAADLAETQLHDA